MTPAPTIQTFLTSILFLPFNTFCNKKLVTCQRADIPLEFPLTGTYIQSVYSNLSSQACQCSYGHVTRSRINWIQKPIAHCRVPTFPFGRPLSGVVPGHPGLHRAYGKPPFFGHIVPAALRTEFDEFTAEALPVQ